jgi:outer membrane protein TolC
LRRAHESLRIAEAGVDLAKRIADMARLRFEAGAGTRLDREQGALVEVRALQEVTDRRAAAQVARFDLARLLGATPDELEALGDPLGAAGATPALEDLIGRARSEHPELRALQAERDAALARAAAARAERRPVPTLEIGAELLDSSTCGGDGRCIGPRGALSFDLPVLNLNAGPIARAEAEARLAALKLHAATVRVDSAVRAAWSSLAAATARARFFEAEFVPKATAVEEMAREGFAAGRTGLLPLLEAERSVLDARQGLTEAQYAIQSARADLEEASGVALSEP